MHDDMLLVESQELLNILECQRRIVFHQPIVKAQKQSLELRNDRILVVTRISDECTSGGAAKQVAGARISEQQGITEGK